LALIKLPEANILIKNMIKNLFIFYITEIPPELNNKKVEESLYLKDQKVRTIGKSKGLSQLNRLHRLSNLKTTKSKKSSETHPNSNHVKKTENNTQNNVFLKSIKESIITCLLDIQKLIIKGYNYIEFIDCIIKYITIFSGNILDRECSQNIGMLEKLKTTPFIIFPTIYQINIKKVMKTLCAPILNFRLSNKIILIHNNIFHPCKELEHDLRFHCNLTHNILAKMQEFTDAVPHDRQLGQLGQLDGRESVSRQSVPKQSDSRTNRNVDKPYFVNLSNTLLTNTTVLGNTMKTIYTSKNNIINKIFPLIDYPVINDDSSTEIKLKFYEKYLNASLLFIFFHEGYFFEKTITNEYIVDDDRTANLVAKLLVISKDINKSLRSGDITYEDIIKFFSDNLLYFNDSIREPLLEEINTKEKLELKYKTLADEIQKVL
jgi:branched-subunit amino acid transport protein AzlD